MHRTDVNVVLKIEVSLSVASKIQFIAQDIRNGMRNSENISNELFSPIISVPNWNRNGTLNRHTRISIKLIVSDR